MEDLTHHDDLSSAKMMVFRGVRDGAALETEAMFSSRTVLLTVNMRFAIGAPTTLVSGTWVGVHPEGKQETGTIMARSVSFSTGPRGLPSMGGRFELVDATGARKYRVAIPLLELWDRLDAKKPTPAEPR